MPYAHLFASYYGVKLNKAYPGDQEILFVQDTKGLHSWFFTVVCIVAVWSGNLSDANKDYFLNDFISLLPNLIIQEF